MINLKFIPFLSRLSKKELAMVFITVFIVLAAVLDRLILSPLLENINLLNAKIKDQKEDIQNSLLMLNQKTLIMAEIDEYKPYIRTAESEEIEVASLLKFVESLAEENSVYLVDIKPAGTAESGLSKKYLIELSLESQMEQILGFFYAIESSDNLLAIETYNIRPKTEGSSVSLCNVQISKIVIP